MRCSNCGSTWHSITAQQRCPFCQHDCTLTPDEIAALYATAEQIPEDEAEKRAEAFLQAAEHGYAPAEYALGLCWETGNGLPRSHSRGAVYFRLAAEQGHAEAAWHLACFLRGKYKGTPEVDEAYFWLRVAAELGSAGAQRMLGDCFNTGEGITENPLRAAFWYTRAAENGDFRAAYQLALLYRDGRGVRQKTPYEKYYAEIALNGGYRPAESLVRQMGEHVFSEVPARIEIKNRNEDRFELGMRAYQEGIYTITVLLYNLAARDGYARAQNSLGVCYANGDGVEKDEATAFTWYTLAAKGGYDLALLNLGDCYRDGRGTQKDEEKAFACYLQAAENGYAQAQYVVGNCYFDATLADRDLPTAMKWYEKAALQGYPEALEKVNHVRADMTELYNRGVDAYAHENYTDAVKYYTVAAEFGHRGAQCNLGYCYQNGMGCEQNMRYAIHFYRKAAEQESGVAEFNLASCYLQGQGGLTYDYAKANELLRRAAAHGAPQAKEVLEELSTRRAKKLAQHIYSISAAMIFRDKDNIADALKLRRLAAEMGNARAMFALGCHYAFGFGMPVDDAASRVWFERAYAAGYRGGSRMKSTLLKMMRHPAGFRPEKPEAATVAAPDGAPSEG